VRVPLTPLPPRMDSATSRPTSERRPAGRLALWLAIAASAAGFAADIAPDALVRKVTADVMDAVGRDRASRPVDRAAAIAIAEEKILPHIDFGEATKLAMGRSWRLATPAQQAALVSEFRTLLVRTYATALESLRDQRVEQDPLRMSPADVEIRVRDRFIRSGSPAVTIDYLMRRTAEGWKVYDIAVDGVSLVLNYRDTFEHEIRRTGIDGLIATLQEKNGTGGVSAR
jgi:phospholipid transport system substrate-binding protein